MKKERVIELARQAGFSAYADKNYISIGVFYGCGVETCTIEILELVRLVEQETLERAAKVCEDAKATVWDFHTEEIKSTAFNTCDNLAYSIRALKGVE